MGKSSSSLKKTKRSKDSSKLRSVKKKKKTKRSKQRKIRRIKDYSNESESSGSDSSLYSSSSEDDYRREKRRSKVSKKTRSRKRYSSSESDDDDDIRLLKKKKRSKRKKRVSSRKRRRRDPSSSSSSSDSSSVQDSQSDDGSESDGKRRTREKRRLGKVKDSRRRSKDEAEEDSERDECWQVDDEVMTEKNSRRLKSIVVVSYNYDDDERKKDMVNDESDENKIVNDLRDGEAVGYEEYNSSETSKASHQDNSLKDDDLEAILKQRALENLKRFRGETQGNGIARKEVSSVSEGETLQTESENFEESQDRRLVEQKLCVSAGNKDLETSQKILQVVNVKESGTGLADLASQQDQQCGDTAKVKPGFGISSCTTKQKLIRPGLRQESLNLASRKETAGCEMLKQRATVARV